MKHRSTGVLILAWALCLLSGWASATGKIKVVATTTDLKGLVQEVGGDLVEVSSIAVPEQDPHTIELKPGHLANLRGAEVVFRIGLDHEPWLNRVPIKAPVVDTSRGVRLTQTATPRLRAERHVHTHAFGNPHYWLDPENAKPITATILEALAAIRPSERKRFEANRTAFIRRLDERIMEWKAAMSPYKGTKLVVIHDTWTYFAESFGLSIVAAAEPHPGVPPSASELSRLFSRMRESGVKLVLAEPSSSPTLVRQLAEHTGAQVAVLSPSLPVNAERGGYIDLFEINIRRLAEKLR